MDIETKLDLIKSEPLEEVITDEELRNLLETNSHPKHYIGLEISGMLHIGHVLMGGKKINDFNKAGIETQVLLADWHTMANNKLGGDWEKIKKVSEFYRKVFNAFCPGTKVVLGRIFTRATTSTGSCSYRLQGVRLWQGRRACSS